MFFCLLLLITIDGCLSLFPSPREATDCDESEKLTVVGCLRFKCVMWDVVELLYLKTFLQILHILYDHWEVKSCISKCSTSAHARLEFLGALLQHLHCRHQLNHCRHQLNHSRHQLNHCQYQLFHTQHCMRVDFHIPRLKYWKAVLHRYWLSCPLQYSLSKKNSVKTLHSYVNMKLLITCFTSMTWMLGLSLAHDLMNS